MQQPELFPRTAFTGWFRDSRRQAWRELVQADTVGACWALMTARLRTHSLGGESVVLGDGIDPNRRTTR